MNLIQAIQQAEACDTSRAIEILNDLGFESDQGQDKVETAKINTCTIIRHNCGYVLAGSSGDPVYSEEFCEAYPVGDRPERFAEAACKIGLMSDEGFCEEDQPWRLAAYQYAAVLIVADDHNGAIELAGLADRYGQSWEDGAWLEFGDGSVYYANGGRHEIWRNASDFYDCYPDAVQQ